MTSFNANGDAVRALYVWWLTTALACKSFLRSEKYQDLSKAPGSIGPRYAFEDI